MSNNNPVRLARLFSGLERAYCIGTPTDEKDKRGKVRVRYETRREPLTMEQWHRHLDGSRIMVPVPIRDDGRVLFGAIDIDQYPLDLEALAAKVRKKDLPLVLCRSKSGGAHLFLFMGEPTSAELVRDRLQEWALVLGYPGVEVFPKQVRLANESDVGNGIVAPYRGANADGSGLSMEYALGPDGQALTLEEFLDLAESLFQDGEDLPKVEPDVDDDMTGAPPCLQYYAQTGIPDGARNEILFDFCVFARRKFGDDRGEDWQAKVQEFNKRYGDPPIELKDLMPTINSVDRRKTYSYKAKCQGPHCNPALCRQREYGREEITGQDPGVDVTRLQVIETDPPIYIVTVNGANVEMDAEALDSSRGFRLQVMKTLQIRPQPVKQDAWEKLLRSLFANIEKIPAPEDAGPLGRLQQELERFFAERLDKDREKLVGNHAWADPKTGRRYFRVADFEDHLKRARLFGHKTRDIYNMVRKMGGGGDLLKIQGQNYRVWWVPPRPGDESSGEPPPPLDVPNIPGEEDDDVPF